MKKIFLLFAVVLCSLSMFAQTDTTNVVQIETEWIAIKASSVDSLTLNYLEQKGLVSYTTPKGHNNNVFVSVLSYLAGLLDSSISSISKNTNKFYTTPVGFWTVWGVFYHYVGNEIINYLLKFLFLVGFTVLFVWLWKKQGIPKMVPVDPMVDSDNKEEVPTTPSTIKYELKPVNANMQFWLLVIYFVVFFILSCII